MNTLETLVIISATLQILVILGAIYVCFVRDWDIWIWFTLGAFGALLRRILTMLRFESGSISHMGLEYLFTMSLSICWLLFLWKIITKKKVLPKNIILKFEKVFKLPKILFKPKP